MTPEQFFELELLRPPGLAVHLVAPAATPESLFWMDRLGEADRRWRADNPVAAQALDGFERLVLFGKDA